MQWVLLGESLRSILSRLAAEIATERGLDSGDEEDSARAREAALPFLRRLCRHLGERHPGDPRILSALVEWVEEFQDYEAFDALLAGFGQFNGRDRLLRQGRLLFPGPLTAHWER